MAGCVKVILNKKRKEGSRSFFEQGVDTGMLGRAACLQAEDVPVVSAGHRGRKHFARSNLDRHTGTGAHTRTRAYCHSFAARDVPLAQRWQWQVPSPKRRASETSRSRSPRSPSFSRVQLSSGTSAAALSLGDLHRGQGMSPCHGRSYSYQADEARPPPGVRAAGRTGRECCIPSLGCHELHVISCEPPRGARSARIWS